MHIMKTMHKFILNENSLCKNIFYLKDRSQSKERERGSLSAGPLLKRLRHLELSLFKARMDPKAFLSSPT